MGFFSELKQDLSQAVNELVPEEETVETAETEAVAEEALEPDGEVQTEKEDALEDISLADMIDNLDNLVLEAEAPEEVQEVQADDESMEVEEFVSLAMEEAEPAPEADKIPEEPRISVENKEEKEEKTIMDTFANRMVSDETSVITAGMKITGDISSEGSLDIIGTVDGNIDILGKLNVTGHVKGNSKASEIYADGAQIHGEIVSEGAIKIGQNSVIIGNITATSAAIAGAVKGNIDVNGPVVLDASAIVMGDIKSKSVQINIGAVIEGMCSQCYADKNPTNFFDEYEPEVKKTTVKGTK